MAVDEGCPLLFVGTLALLSPYNLRIFGAQCTDAAKGLYFALGRGSFLVILQGEVLDGCFMSFLNQDLLEHLFIDQVVISSLLTWPAFSSWPSESGMWLLLGAGPPYLATTAAWDWVRLVCLSSCGYLWFGSLFRLQAVVLSAFLWLLLLL